MLANEHFPLQMILFERLEVQVMIKTAQIKNKNKDQDDRKRSDRKDSSTYLLSFFT